MSENTLTIPPKTSLLSIERLGLGWAVWINTNNEELKKPHQRRQGTYLLLNINGSVDRITVDGDSERSVRVMNES